MKQKSVDYITKANTTDTEAQFLDIHLSIANGFMINVMPLILIYLRFLDGDVPRRASYGVNISHVLGLLVSAIILRSSKREINV